MNKEDLLRVWDGLVGMLCAYDNQNPKSCLTKEVLEGIEQIRELIKDMKDE